MSFGFAANIQQSFDHGKFFREFCFYEKLTGGPDPHMRAVVDICGSGLSREDQLWRAHLYVGVYNVPTAEVLWTFLRPDSKETEKWLDAHWMKLKLRRERRTVKSPRRLAEYLTGFHRVLNELHLFAKQDFEALWDFSLSLPHIGRYAATKLCEIWYRLGFVTAECPDIRPLGGWSPRAALSLIYPKAKHDPHNNARCDEANALARRLKPRDLSWFEFEVMLCEYKESFSTHRQYPGRSLDSELAYELAVAPLWATRYRKGATEHMRARSKLSPKWALGEVQGWSGPRPLGDVLAKYGYTWSDSVYNYIETTDLSRPAKRSVESRG